MNPFGVSGLLIGFTSSLLGIFVYIKNSKNKINRLWALFTFLVAIWGFGGFMISRAHQIDDAIFWWRATHIGIIFIPILFVHFVYIFLEKKNLTCVYLSYVIGCIFLGLNFTDYFINNAELAFGSFYYDGRPPTAVYSLFVFLWLSLIVYSHYELLVAFFKSPEHKRNQIKYFFLATFVGFLGGGTSFLPVFDIDLYPYGNFTVPLYPLIMTYAIVKHQLMDIDVIIRRTAVFAGLFAFVYGTFSVVSMLGQELFSKYFGWEPWASTIPTVLMITLLLRPLDRFLTNATERFLFQKKYDYRDLLKTFTNEVLTVLDLQKLTEQTILGLSKIIKLESASILLLNKDAKRYAIAVSSGVKDKDITFTENDTVVSFLKETNQPILKDKSADTMSGHSHLRDDFKKLNAQLCLPISHHDELIGVLALGMKKSGGEFSQEDIDILMTLARTLGIAIANAQLFDQLSKTQAEAAQREKMAVIGTLAAGINHEICNPLGIVRGQCEMFLLNLRDGLYEQKSKEDMNRIAVDIMNKVIRETDRATAITKKLSGFAKPSKKTENEEVSVEKEVDEVLGLLGHDLKLNNIEFRKSFTANFPAIRADKRQIQEVLFNIIRNAAQAIDKKEGEIELSGMQMNGAAVIKITDNGSGIPPDKIGQIFNPFFTTKEPGKGTGLGLFIVRQVIERNKGTIQVESKEGEGTTFTLTFPVAAQAKVAA